MAAAEEPLAQPLAMPPVVRARGDPLAVALGRRQAELEIAEAADRLLRKAASLVLGQVRSPGRRERFRPAG
jgi:hypothetical protein